MALIIEDGNIEPTATSYATLEEIRAYAVARGVNLPVDNAAVEVLAIKAMDYIESKANQFVGKQTSPANQPLSWPRCNVAYSDGLEFPSNVVPVVLKSVQAQLVIEQFKGIDLMPSVEAGGYVVSEQIDVIKTQYSEKIVSRQPFMPAVDALLSSLLSTDVMQLRSIRV